MGIDYDKQYADVPKKPQEPVIAPQPVLEPLSATEATPVLLAALIDRARLPDADPKIISQALDALLKREYGESDKDRAYDIRMIMGVMCEECMKKLGETV